MIQLLPESIYLPIHLAFQFWFIYSWCSIKSKICVQIICFAFLSNLCICLKIAHFRFLGLQKLCVLIVTQSCMYNVIILLFRNHLFIWSVFSPKLLYIVTFTCMTYIFSTLIVILISLCKMPIKNNFGV